jgi:hypothetical protein
MKAKYFVGDIEVNEFHILKKELRYNSGFNIILFDKQMEKIVNFKISLSNKYIKNLLYQKVCFYNDCNWSSIGLVGVLFIEKIFKLLGFNSYISQAAMNDGLEIYFWSRVGYKPLLNNTDKNHFYFCNDLEII